MTTSCCCFLSNHTRDKIKVVLDLSYCNTKIKLKCLTYVDTFNIAAKSNFIASNLNLTNNLNN